MRCVAVDLRIPHVRRKLALTFDLIAVLRDLNQKYHKKAAEKDIR